MNRAWILLPIAALATLLVIPLATVLGEDDDEPSVQPVELGAEISYQGRFMDDDEPANGEYDIRFILFDDDAGGSQVGETITQEDIEVSEGLFTTLLDFGTASFDGEARWLEIAVRAGGSEGNFTVLNPRQPITAVPYALHALTSGGFTVPLVASGDSADPIVQVTQAGDGLGLEVTREESDLFGDALNVRNEGEGAALYASSIYDGGYAVDANASGADGVAGSFSGHTALFLTGGISVGGDDRAAFKVFADTATNTCDSDAALIVDNTYANGEETAMLFVTMDASGAAAPAGAPYVQYDQGGDCPAGQWVIRLTGAGTWTDNDIVNVLVVNLGLVAE